MKLLSSIKISAILFLLLIATVSILIDAALAAQTRRTLGSCTLNDAQKTYDANEKGDGLVFIICDAPQKVNFSEAQIKEIKKISSNNHNPTILLNDLGEMVIDTPFKEFTIEKYQDNDVVSAWQGVISALEYIKENAANNITHRFWALRSIEGINKALQGPLPFEVITSRNRTTVLKVTNDLSACSALEEFKAEDDADVKVERSGSNWSCSVSVNETAGRYYNKPRRGSKAENILYEALQSAKDRKRNISEAQIQIMLDKYEAAVPYESENGVLKMRAPATLVIANYQKTQADQTLSYLFAATNENKISIDYELAINDEIVQKAGGKKIGLTLYLEDNNNQSGRVAQVAASKNPASSGQISLDLTQIDKSLLGLGDHRLRLALQKEKETTAEFFWAGETLSGLEQNIKIAALRDSLSSYEDCVKDEAEKICITRADPRTNNVVTIEQGGGNNITAPTGQWQYYGYQSSLDYLGASSVSTASAILSAPVSGVRVYCRGDANYDADCADKSYFLVYKVSEIVVEAETRGTLNDYLISKDRAKIPFGLDPSKMDNVFDDKGNEIAERAKEHEALGALYQAVANAAGEYRNSVDQGGANRAIFEVERRLSSSLASYQKPGNYTIYNLAKHIKNAGQRRVLTNDEFPVRSYDAESDKLEIFAGLDSAKILVNGLNKSSWESIKNLYEAIAASAGQLDSTGDAEAKRERDQAASLARQIEEKLNAYQPSSAIYERGGDNFIVYNIEQYGFSQLDVENIKYIEYFQGRDIQNFFQDGKAKIPTKISASQISNTITPAVVAIAAKISSLYEAVKNEAEAKQSYADSIDANESIQTIKKEIIDKYVAAGGCLPNSRPYDKFGGNFIICEASKKLGADTVQSIKFGTTITINENDELSLPFSINQDEIKITFSEKKSLTGWQAVTAAYQFVADNASNNFDDFRNAKGSKEAVEAALAGPPPYEIAADRKSVRITASISTCAEAKVGEDPNVVVAITVQDSTKASACTIERKEKYESPQADSKLEAILTAAIAEAVKRQDTAAAMLMQEILDTYKLQIPSKTEKNGFSIAAPAKLKQTKELAKFVDPLNDVTAQNPPANYFEGYADNSISVKYKISDQNYLLSSLQQKNKSNYGVKLYIFSNGEKTLADEYRSSNRTEDTLYWKVTTDNQPIHLTVGSHQFEVVLFGHNLGEPAANDLEITRLTQDFEVLAPDNYGEHTSNGGYNGASVSLQMPNEIIEGETAQFKISLTPPTNNKAAGEKDYYMLFISKAAANADPHDIETSLWVLKEAKEYSAGSRPAEIIYSWRSGYTNVQDQNRHFTVVLNIRSKVAPSAGNPYDAKLNYVSNDQTIHVTAETWGKIFVKPKTAGKEGCTVLPNGKEECPDSGAKDIEDELDGMGSSIKKIKSATDLFDKNSLVGRIINFLVDLISGLAVLGVIISGLMFIMANGDSAKAEKAKKYLIYSVTAVVVTVLSWIILKAVTNTLEQYF